MIVSCEIMFSVNGCSKTIEMKMFCRKWDDLAEEDHTYRMSESEYFHYKQNGWISLNKSGNTEPIRKRSDFNQALSTLNRLHREAGGRQLRTHALLEVQTMEIVMPLRHRSDFKQALSTLQ